MDNEITPQEASEIIKNIRSEIERVFIGQQTLVTNTLVTLIAGGHILVEGVPGLGKTLLVRSIAAALTAKERRVQFTPDLMPSDITGNIMLDASGGKFITKKGPVFTNILIADELNRAPAKTQAALFEAMQEYQVSLDGESHALPRPFMVLATENPFEHEGTYPLPDAQKDRFLMKVIVDYPSIEEEKTMAQIVLQNGGGKELSVSGVRAVTTPERFEAVQRLAGMCKIDESIIDYTVRITAATRGTPALQSGAGPRGSLSLLRAGRARALMQERDFVIPDDIKTLAVPALAHRLTLSAESELEGITEKSIVEKILNETPAPRE
ncbi:hypothetical protein FACS189494_02180 [Spirochaetia bacterium]|nr:hypothetical protein FACS189494_02180 [Spirochaetia bacterium]